MLTGDNGLVGTGNGLKDLWRIPDGIHFIIFMFCVQTFLPIPKSLPWREGTLRCSDLRMVGGCEGLGISCSLRMRVRKVQVIS